MAEPTNPPQTPAPAPAAPPAAAPAPTKTQGPSPFGKALKGLLTTAFWILAGVVLILLAFIENAYHLTRIIPELLRKEVFKAVLWPYLFAGLGSFCLAHARSLTTREYAAEVKKNRRSPHAWKIPLLGFQVFLLYLAAIYLAGVGVGMWMPVKNMVASTFLIFVVLGYALWYAVEHFRNHFPTFAGLRIAILALILAVASYLVWVRLQQVVLALILAFFALAVGIGSLVVQSAVSREQRGWGLRMASLVLTGMLVLTVGYYILPFGKPHAELKGLGLTFGDPAGEIGRLAYAQPGIQDDLTYRHNENEQAVDQRLAFSLKSRKEGWFLQVVDAGNRDLPIFKRAAGEDAFRPVFVEKGRALLADVVEGGQRGLWRIDAKTGDVLVLRKSGLLPLQGGVPWHEPTGRFLFTTQDGETNRLQVWNAATNSFRTLLKSSSPILTPSWTRDGRTVAYADGSSGLFWVLDATSGEKDFFRSQMERAEGFEPENAPISEVVPAPDGFRYLYVVRQGGGTTLWTVLAADGTKRKPLYSTQGEILDLAWHPNGQGILFEERKRRHGSWKPTGTVRLLDANLGTFEDLLLPQLDHRSPAVSPDGVKIAFVANQGLWYPSRATGLWVALLR